MFFEALRPTYHIPITIDSHAWDVFVCIALRCAPQHVSAGHDFVSPAARGANTIATDRFRSSRAGTFRSSTKIAEEEELKKTMRSALTLIKRSRRPVAGSAIG